MLVISRRALILDSILVIKVRPVFDFWFIFFAAAYKICESRQRQTRRDAVKLNGDSGTG